jgi:alkanesulfonate monooxygenase SsuD/methylene tetrahydromethanopterin reductase-like flavin-dependent oxidoreductase (luciferase family)
MKFGYFTLTDNPSVYGVNRRDPNQFLREALEECQGAKKLGYHSASVQKHHFDLFGCLPAPSVFLAHLAAKAKRIQLVPVAVLLQWSVSLVT